MNKKGQVGSALTWVSGFLIIFFIMLLFLGASLYLSTQKKITGEKVEISIEEKTGDLILTKKFSSFLNTPVKLDNEDKKVLDLIILLIEESEKEDEIIQKIDNVIGEPCKRYSLKFLEQSLGDGTNPEIVSSLELVHDGRSIKMNYGEEFTC